MARSPRLGDVAAGLGMKIKPGLHPTTTDAAVRALVSLVPQNEQIRIAAMAQDDLSLLHHSLGQWIRNYFGLWAGNVALLDATGAGDPDGASGVIIKCVLATSARRSAEVALRMVTGHSHATAAWAGSRSRKVLSRQRSVTVSANWFGSMVRQCRCNS